jgi:hypothetical protein
MSDKDIFPYKDAIVAEYANIRAEILQLNGQIFTILTGSLALNVTILGWMFSKDDPSKYLYLPTIGVIVMFVACILLLNRYRLSHRLAIFQKVFIESRIPDICWARVSLQYRDEYSKHDKTCFSSWGERIAESGVYTLSIIQLVNLIIFVVYAILPWFTEASRVIDWFKVFNLLIILFLFGIQYQVQKKMTDYNSIQKAMKEIFKKSTLIGS